MDPIDAAAVGGVRRAIVAGSKVLDEEILKKEGGYESLLKGDLKCCGRIWRNIPDLKRHLISFLHQEYVQFFFFFLLS